MKHKRLYIDGKQTVTVEFVCLQHGMTALIWASGRGHTQVVEELLDAGADANSADKVSAGSASFPFLKISTEVAFQLFLLQISDLTDWGTFWPKDPNLAVQCK